MKPANGKGQRLQKALSRAGVASRRKAEKLIAQGRVTVNGELVTDLGTRVQQTDAISVDGAPVEREPDYQYLLVHKPTGCICTLSDPEGRPTVVDLIPDNVARLFPVGRLDWNSEGLLLLTNDGGLTNRLTHPRFQVERIYQAKVKGKVGANDSRLVKFRKGVTLDDGTTAKAKEARMTHRAAKHSWIEIVLTEGRNREVRRMCETVGWEVLRLRRIGFGPLRLDDLPMGAWRWLKPHEIKQLKRM